MLRRIIPVFCALVLVFCADAARAGVPGERSAELPLELRLGYYGPAASEMDGALLTGIGAEFFLSQRLRVSTEYDYVAAHDCKEPAAGAVTYACNASTHVFAVTVKTSPGEKGGFYYGAGLARERTRVSLSASVGGNVYNVTSRPSQTGVVLLAGYKPGKSGLSLEARYMFAGKKQWDPMSSDGMNMGGFSVVTGYRFFVK